MYYKDGDRYDKIVDIFTTYDLTLSKDLLGWWYAHDPLCILETPSFETPMEVSDWLLKNCIKVEEMFK